MAESNTTPPRDTTSPESGAPSASSPDPYAGSSPIPRAANNAMIVLMAIASFGATLLIGLTVLRQHQRPPGSITLSAGTPAAVARDLASESPGPPSLGGVAPFSLVTSDGRPLNEKSLAGKTWIVDFIFTRCPGPCPRMTSRMAQMQAWLTSEPLGKDVALLSICVDPVNDTQEAMTQYAKLASADPNRWIFASGSRDQIIQAAGESFRVPVVFNKGNTTDPIVHTQKFVLIDPTGQVRGYYEGTDDRELTALRRDVLTLVTSADH
jgi:cytochrome oxidase Cu insertion factor (SCO1/SenC/PrrC family)